MNNLFHYAIAILLCIAAWSPLHAQRDLLSDTWVATDALGRKMPLQDSVGCLRQDKQRFVGIFYVTWHDQNTYYYGKDYCDVSQVLDKDPGARINGESEAWPKGGYSWFWGEPEYGYFLSRDKYVIRHDMSMLTDAGVDVIILDVTNAACYWGEWETIFSVMEEMRSEGNIVPKVCFWTYNGPAITVTQNIYDRIYKNGRFKELWFYWDGKPLMLCNLRPGLDANGGGVDNPNPHYDEKAASDPSHPHYGDPDYALKSYKDYSSEVRNFFTLRNMWWGYYTWWGKRYVGTEDNWSFGFQMDDKNVADLTPVQRASTHQGRVEEMAVTPAQHPISTTGKSWRVNTGEPALNEKDVPAEAFVPWLGKSVKESEGYGIYFQDRWDEAIEADPEFIYLNDWNEWIAGKYPIGVAPDGRVPGPSEFLGRKNNTFYFVDQYNAEFNRTIGPVKGRYTDNYYMQMAQNIRRYKGVRAIPKNHGMASATIDGRFDEWHLLPSYYLDTRGDTYHRDHNGYAGHHYTNTTGRNDILETKVMVDKKRLYFYVNTADTISPHTDSNWMLLLIDADNNSETGWYGYDFIINKSVSDNHLTSLMGYDAVKKQWTFVANIPYAVKGNELELSVPRKLMALKGNNITFDFKWSDNPQSLTDPISLCTDGDTAPNRRFNYRFIWSK